MGASITIDINAKVQGYQAAIEKMKAEFAKIDPGSDIGKKLAKALSAADSQVKNLSRNLFPKASSDTQIDAIIDKVNRVGESVLQVSQLMQSVGTTDLNFSALGSDVEELRSKIASLQSDLESKLGQGILEAAKSSEQLRSVLEGILGIDLDKISGKDLFSAIEKGALKAAKEVENANAAVKKAQDNINASKTKVSNLENGLLGTFASKENMQQQVRELESQYTDAVSGLRDKISSALAQKFAEGADIKPDELLNSFLSGLTPETIKEKINELYESLKSAGAYHRKDDFFKDFFGDFKNINQTVKNIDLSALEAVMTKFKELIQATKGEIGSANEQSITSLIDTGMIKQAGKETSAAFEKAFRSTRNTIDAEQKKTVEKLEPQYQAALQQRADAVQRQAAVDTARTNLNAEVTQLKEQLAEQQKEIDRLNEQLNQLAQGKLTNLKTSGGTIGRETAENMFPSGAAQKYQEQLHRVEAAEQAIGKIKGVSQRWFSIYAVVRMVTNAIKKAIATIKELDDTITEIAIVTNMTQSELWGQMSSYSALADKYAASISGVYKVSQLYYQQGLQQAEVMELTEQTLKMARISGLDYAEATDYMTNAVRSFKMEMSEAQTVVDVYSAVAASSATSVTELASAMSKTASSAQAVGSSFQNTTAMLAVMIEATRESPENIGSAMKSIISRYGELKENTTGIDSEGEEYSLNKVDKALQSIGISIHDVNGQFREFDDVIFELASKWDTVDKNTQRYIATVMAGNRQQSRFLALVSSGQRLQEMSSTAENSEDAAQLQYLKVLDSITAKTQNLQNALQSLYLNSGFEQLNKDLLDFGTGVIKVFSSMNQWLGKPIPAILAIGSTFYNVANIATAAFQLLSTRLHARAEILKGMITRTSQQGVNERYVLLQDETERIIAAWDKREQQFITHQERLNEIQRNGVNTRAGMEEGAPTGKWGKVKNFFGNSKVKMGASLGASALSLITTGLASGAQQRGDKETAGKLGVASSTLSGIAMGSSFGLKGMLIGGLAGLVTGFVSNLGNIFRSAEDKLKDLKEEAEKANNEYLQKKSETTDLDKQIKQLKELEKHRYDSVEAEEAYYEAANKMGETYPTLIKSVDEVGNVTIDLANAENELTNSRSKAVKAAQDAAVKNYAAAQQQETVSENKLIEYKNDLLIGRLDDIDEDKDREIIEKIRLGIFKKYAINSLDKMVQMVPASLYASDEKTQKEYTQWLQGKAKQDILDYNPNDAALPAWYKTWLAESVDQGKWQEYGPSDSGFSVTSTGSNANIPFEYVLQALSEDVTDQVLKDFLNNIVNSDNVIDVNEFEKLDSTSLIEFYDQMAYKIIFESLSQIAELNRSRSSTVSTARSGIAQTIGASLIGTDKTFISELTGGSGILTELAMKTLYNGNKSVSQNQYNSYVKGDNAPLLKDTEKWSKTIEDVWVTLTSSKQQQVNDLLKNANRYSSTQLQDELEKILIGLDGTVTQAMVDNAQSKLYDIEKFEQKFINRNAQRDKAKKEAFTSIFNALKDQQNGFGSPDSWDFGPAELEAMADLQDEIDNYVDNGKMSIENAQGFVNAYIAILKQLPKDSELREKAQKLIFDNKDWSITGLYELVNSMANIGINKTVLDEVRGLGNYVPKNLVANLDSFTNSITSKFEDFQKALKNASDGMDLKDALKFVDKLGMSLNDLDFKNGKFYTKHDFTPEDVEKAYLNWNNELYQQLEKDYNSFAGKNGILQGVYDIEGNKTLDVLKNIINQTKNWDSLDTIEDRVSAIREAGSLSELEDKEIISAINLYDQYYKAWEDQSVTENGEKSFNAYVLNQLTQSYENAQAALQTASEYEVNSFLLRNGGIEAFVEQIGRQETDDNGEITRQGLTESQKERLTAAIRTGDLTSLQDDELLWSYVRQYVDVVGDAFKDVQKRLGEALLASFENGGPKTIAVTKENLEVIKAHKGLFNLTQGQEIKEGDILTFQDIQTFKADNTLFNNYILDISDTQKDALENLQKYHKALYGTKFKDISNLLDETTSIGYDEFTNYLASIGDLVTTNDAGEKTIVSDANLAEKYGVKISELTGDFIIKNLDTYIAGLQRDLGTLNDSNSSVQERNAIKAKIASARSQQAASQKKATEDILKSYNSISVEQRKAFADAFEKEFDSLNTIFKSNDDGTYKLDISALQTILNDANSKISSATRDYLNELIAKIADDYLAKIETAASYIVKGTTKQEDIAKIVSEFNKRYNAGATVSSLFKWDDILEAFTFKPEYLQYYIQMQREELANAGFNDDQIEAYISNQIKQITNAIDITGFYGSENHGVGSKSRQTLRNQISAALFANAKFQSENFEDYLDHSISRSRGRVVMAEQEAQLAKEDNERLVRELNQQSDNLFAAINSGGQAAIEAMKTLYQGQELSAEQVEAAYRAQLNNFSNAFDAIEGLSINSVVDQNTKEILNQIKGFSVNQDGVIMTVGTMIDAYQAIYDKMEETSVATTAELNSAYAKLLTTKDVDEINAIETLNNAMGMTYEALGSLLTQQGIKLKDALSANNIQKYGLEKLGNGKVRINNFKQFAAQMKWNPNSDEYFQAYKAYNDSLITLDKQAADRINEEFKALVDGKAGDAFNFTYLEQALRNNTNLNKQIFAEKLANVGAYFQDGILKTVDNADMSQIAILLVEAATEAGQEISDEFKDVIQSILKSYSDTIIKGINGGLTNVEATKLTNIGKSLGINDISFNKTTEGLQLAQKSAMDLYFALKKTDALQAELVFNALNKSLQETNEHYKDISDILNRIKELEGIKDSTKIQQYEKELALAKEILAVRSTTEDSSFSFMSNKIPGAQNNPLNYYKNWAQAWKTLTDAFKPENYGSYIKRNGDISETIKSGFVDYEDWYNIVNEMNNIAKLGGKFEVAGVKLNGSLKAASELIQKGAASLVATDTGDIKVALNGMELKFTEGTADFSDGVDKGIKELAQSQVKMLDGMIQLMETIVAIEKLGEIDTNGNGLDLGEIFKVKFDDKGFQLNQKYWDQFTNEFITIANQILNDKNFTDALKAIQINGHTMHEMLSDATDGIKNLDMDAEVYTAVMNAFYQAAISGNYDLDNIVSSIKEILAGTGFEGTIDLGDTALTFDYGVALETKDGKYIVNGQKYDTIDAAVSAMKVKSLDSLQGQKGTDTGQDGIVTYQQLGVTVKYDCTNDEYIADFEEFSVITNSAEGISLAIAAHAKDQLKNNKSVDNEPIQLTYTYPSETTVVYEIKDNKVEVIEGTAEKEITDQLQNTVIEQAEKTKQEQVEVDGELNAKVSTLNLAAENVNIQGTGEGEGETAPTVPEMSANIDVLKLIPQMVEVVWSSTDSDGNFDLESAKANLINLLLLYTGTNPDTTGILIPETFPINGTHYATLIELILKMAAGKQPDSEELKTLAGEAAQIEIPWAAAIIAALLMGAPQDIKKEDLENAANVAKDIPGLESIAEIIEMVLQMQDGKTPNSKPLEDAATEVAAQGVDAGNATATASSMDIGISSEVVTTNGLDNAAQNAAQDINAGEVTATASGMDVTLSEDTEVTTEGLDAAAHVAAQKSNAGKGVATATSVDVDVDSGNINTKGLDAAAHTAAQNGNAGEGKADATSVDVNANAEVVNTTGADAVAHTAAQEIKAGSGKGTISDLIVSLPDGITAKYNKDSITISQITASTGTVRALTITKIEDVTGTATNAEVTAEHYHITFEETDPLTGEIIKTEEIIIPASLADKLDLNGLFDESGNYVAQDLVATVKTQLDRTGIKDLEEWVTEYGAVVLRPAAGTGSEVPIVNGNGSYNWIERWREHQSLQKKLYNNNEASAKDITNFYTTEEPEMSEKEAQALKDYEIQFKEIKLADQDEDFDWSDWQSLSNADLIGTGQIDLLTQAFLNYQTASNLDTGAAFQGFINDLTSQLNKDGNESIAMAKAVAQSYLMNYLQVSDNIVDELDNLNNINDIINLIITQLNEINTKPLEEDINGLTSNIEKPVDKEVGVDIAEAEQDIQTLNEKASATVVKRVKIVGNDENGTVAATGTIGLAKAQGTLMGELGPELYVQNGRYFVAGQNGPEFVDLAPDAIVFNHLQTRSLLDKGMSPGRGKAITNERTAVSYAKGNINGGPAMASASAALAALKQLRAQWQALMDMSVADLAGKGGGGGGGGDKDLPGFIRDVERWYNWLQKIADLEKQINYEEQLRSKIQSDMISNGKAFYTSQKRQLDQLKDSITTSSSLYLSQLEYFEKRRDQLNNNSPLSELYTFDETGQLHYQEGSYQWLAQLFKTNDYGALKLTPKQQYEMILARNPQFAQYMKYNSEGKEIKQEDYKENKDQYYLDMVKAFSDRMDSEKEEMQNLFDSFNEQAKAVNEKLQKQNELIQAMKDNQKEVEEAVLGAIVESRERQIKELQDTKDALQKSNQDFIDGLSKQLDKEQKMYQNSQKDQELQRNRRQLAILQRSGASASQIAQLQKQIEQQSQDEYFTKQQEQIDAVKEASDLQIERLDHQIEIEQEQLEYEKANGLLWSQVYEVMAKTPEEISAFIQENTAAEWAKSPLSSTEAANDWIFKTEQWTEYRDDIHGIYDALTAAWNMFDESMKQMFGSGWEGLDDETKKSLQNKFMQVYQETGDYNEAAKTIQQTDTYQQLKKKQDEETAAAYTPVEQPGEQKVEENKNKYQVYWRVFDDKGYVLGEGSGLGKTKAEALSVAEYYAKKRYPNADPSRYEYSEVFQRYASGGLIDYTGPAWVDGTPQKPESIWDAETTKLMRDNLLNPRSLNLLGTFWDTLQGYQSATNHSYSSNSESLVIENAVVNMNVASIADDYDARRAGDQALEEMLWIARKSGTRSV